MRGNGRCTAEGYDAIDVIVALYGVLAGWAFVDRRRTSLLAMRRSKLRMPIEVVGDLVAVEADLLNVILTHARDLVGRRKTR